jgi:hypothetical protein
MFPPPKNRKRIFPFSVIGKSIEFIKPLVLKIKGGL